MRTACLLLCLLPALAWGQERQPPREVLLSKRILNVAHRGGAGEGPEQTVVAFRNAVKRGADVLELDVHRTSDGTVVVCHDTTVDRTTDGKGQLKDMTLAQIRKLDAGHRYSADGGKTFPHRAQGVTVPTFREVLAAFPTMPFVVEIKQTEPPITRDVLAILDAVRAVDRVVMSSAHDHVLADVRKANPKVLTGFARGELIAFARLNAETEKGYQPPGDYLQMPSAFVTPKMMARAKRFNLRLHAWTVNEPKEMRRLQSLGVEGIMTDYPSRLAELLAPVRKPTAKPKKFFK